MRHIPVLHNEVIESLQLTPGKNVVDCTLGDGGHAEAILQQTQPDGKLLGIDNDPEAILRAKQYLYEFDSRVIFARDNFQNLNKIVSEKKFTPVGGVLLDLGWSSQQFEGRGRGFSFSKAEEPLDMRYDIKQGITAADIINYRNKEELIKIFKRYGEEKLSKKIASAILEKRAVKEFTKVGELVDIILQVYGSRGNLSKIHPATRVFQALRIAVNDELEVLQKVLPQAVEILEPGGRLVVISFHSLEDRIVKHFFKKIKNIEIIAKKPITASEEELKDNPRARSAKLRVIQK